MGGLFGKQTQSNTPVRLNAIQINQSAYGNTIPLLYGTDRVQMTLIDYQDFKSTGQTTREGKGGGSQTTTGYTYSASFVGLLFSGPTTGGVLTVYSDQTICTLATAPGGPLTLFKGASGQAPWSYMTTNHPTHALSYDGSVYIGAANYSLGSSAAIPNISFESQGLARWNNGADAHPRDVIVDYCTDPNHGVGFPYLNVSGFDAPNGWRDYCTAMGFLFSILETTQRSAASFIGELLQETNSNAVWSAGLGLRIVPYGDQLIVGNGVTYAPDLSPIFTFIDDDYLAPDGAAPVKVSITPSSQTYNVWNIEFLDRTNQYNTAIETYRDEQDITVNGLRIAPTVNLHGIKIRAIAATVAALLAQRNIYIRSTFTFTVRKDYSLLEPMDLIAINDSRAGIVNQLARIIETTDNADESFTIVAEEMLVGPAHAPVYNTQLSAGYAANYGADPGSVDTPYIFTLPPLLADPTNGGYEMGIAVGGKSGLWRGCVLYASMDNVSYERVGIISRASRYGKLSSAISSGSDPDTVSTLNVQLNGNAEQGLTSVSRSDADNLRSLMLVDGEVMAYQNAIPLGNNAFQLSYLRRNAYGSPNTAHAVNSQFTMLDDGIFRMRFDPGFVGQPIWFKFVSFNIFGGGMEDFSAVTAYQGFFQGQNGGQLLSNGATPLVARGECVNVGNKIYKRINATPSWDTADCYSVDAFSGGCTVKFQACQTDKEFMIGLNSDPKTDASYTSIDYAWYAAADGSAYIYESAQLVQTTQPYSVNTVFEVRYDGKYITYYMDGVQWRTVPAPGKVLFMDSSFYRPGAAAQNVYFGSLNPSSPTPFVARGNCRVSNETFSKVGGVFQWDSDIYSLEGYPVAHVSFKPNQTNADLTIGFSVSPGSDQSYTSVHCGMQCASNGRLYALLGGAGQVQISATYATTDILTVLYDGVNVDWLRNGTPLYSIPLSSVVAVAPNVPVFLDSSFYTPGCSVNSLQYGPSLITKQVDTTGLAINSATTVFVATVAGPVNVHVTTGIPFSQRLLFLSNIGPFTTDVDIVVTGQGYLDSQPSSVARPILAQLRIIPIPNVSPPPGVVIANVTTSTAVQTSFALESNFTLAAGGTVSYELVVQDTVSGSGGATNFSGVMLKAEVIKR